MLERTDMRSIAELPGNTLDILMKEHEQIDARREHQEPFYRLKYCNGPEPAFRFDQQCLLFSRDLKVPVRFSNDGRQD